jgi:four helix bundle protein
MSSYKTSKVWHLSNELARDVHFVARDIGEAHASGLNPKLRRASATVPAAIAESAERSLEHERQECYRVARMAARELHQGLKAAHELQLITEEEFRNLAQRTVATYKLLTALAQP